jgi:hypothetical protein
MANLVTDGKNIVFVSAVYPDCKDDACNKQRDEELKKSKVKAKIFSRLFYRHWSAFTEFKRSHLFVQSVGRPCQAREMGCGRHGPTRDLTPGDRCAAVLVRRAGHMRFRPMARGRLHEQHRRSRSDQHE